MHGCANSPSNHPTVAATLRVTGSAGSCALVTFPHHNARRPQIQAHSFPTTTNINKLTPVAFSFPSLRENRQECFIVHFTAGTTSKAYLDAINHIEQVVARSGNASCRAAGPFNAFRFFSVENLRIRMASPFHERCCGQRAPKIRIAEQDPHDGTSFSGHSGGYPRVFIVPFSTTAD